MADRFESDEGMRFEGATCKSVCSACAIFAAQREGLCNCYAECKMGECGAGVLPHIGWSNNEVSTPRTLWSAACNHGYKNCEAECMDDKLKKEIKDCENVEVGNPTDCFHRLSEIYKPVRHDARKNVHYCIRKGMEMCDTFLYPPREGAWKCYDEAAQCDAKAAAGFKVEIVTIEAPTP